MSRRPRRNHTSAFKAKVAIASIKGDRTLVQLAEQFDVHPNQISTWKDQLLEGAAEVFATSSSARPSTPKVYIKVLHAKIGELTLENDFLESALDKAGLLSARRLTAIMISQRQSLLQAAFGVGRRSCTDAAHGRAAFGVPLRRRAHAAGA